MHRLALLFLVGCGTATPATPRAPDPAPGPAPGPAVDLASPLRTDAERARDGARHPAQTLAFFGLRQDSHVVELWPGGGWYTAILAPYLREHGALSITLFDPDGDPKAEETREAKGILARLASDPAFAKVTPVRIAAPAFSFGPDASADLVLTFRNVHNWLPAGTAPAVFAAAARVLKPGGTLGVVDHRAAHDLTPKQVDDTGYVSEAQVIALATAAGLVLDARSEINANPRDTKDHPKGVWSLPPTYAGGDADRARFTAIGESDRLTLRFRKP